MNKTKQLTDRAEKMEAAARPAHQEKSAGTIRLANAGTHAKALVAIEDCDVTTADGRLLFKTPKLWVNKGDRVVILGGNGAGKSHLIRMVAAAMKGDGGSIRAAATAILGYSDQNLSQLDPKQTPMQAITYRFDVGDQRARGMLAQAGMDLRLQDSPTQALSGGQKARLAMLVLRLSNPNFYLLDEPTNHLDIEGQEMLEVELQEQEASCLLVSHDRTFVRNVGTRFWEVQRKRLVEVDDPEPFFAKALAE